MASVLDGWRWWVLVCLIVAAALIIGGH